MLGLTSKTFYAIHFRMHIPPEVWGPFFWHTIHITALGYPTNPSYAHKKAAKEFYESLQLLVPCPICRDHYKEHITKHPLTPYLDKREDLFRWTVMLHNDVNKMLGKKEFTEAQVLEHLQRLGTRGRSPVWSPDDFAEGDWKSRLQGVAIGAGLTAVLVGTLWYLQQTE